MEKITVLPIPEKAIKRSNEELIALHKRVLRTYLRREDISVTNIKKFFVIYDYCVSHKNIRDYFHLPSRVFIIALLTDTLEETKTTYRPNGDNSPRDKEDCQYV